MKGCSGWIDEIADCALGKTPEPDFAAHLEICPQCENALRENRAIAAQIEDAFHRVVAVEPPQYGPDRVMARIHGQANTHAWWRWAAALSVMAALLIAIAMWTRRPSPNADVIALSTWRSPTQALLSPPVAAAWTTTPRLAQEFFKIKLKGEKGETHAK